MPLVMLRDFKPNAPGQLLVHSIVVNVGFWTVRRTWVQNLRSIAINTSLGEAERVIELRQSDLFEKRITYSFNTSGGTMVPGWSVSKFKSLAPTPETRFRRRVPKKRQAASRRR